MVWYGMVWYGMVWYVMLFLRERNISYIKLLQQDLSNTVWAFASAGEYDVGFMDAVPQLGSKVV